MSTKDDFVHQNASNFHKEHFRNDFDKNYRGKIDAQFASFSGNDIFLKKQVFVPPAGYRELSQQGENRIFIISGDESADGATTVAIRLAADLLESTSAVTDGLSEQIKLFRQGTNILQRLDTIIQSHDLQENWVIIVKGVDMDSLREDTTNAAVYHKELASKKLHLILTTTNRRTASHAAYVSCDVGKISLEAVFDQHLTHYTDSDLLTPADRALLRDQRGEICAVLEKPPQIGEFFRALEGYSPLNEEKIQLLQKKVTEVPQLKPGWFQDSLNMNERLFGLLSAITQSSKRLSGLISNIYDLEDLYYGLVGILREERGLDHENALIDPRRIGTIDMIDRLGIVDSTKNETTGVRYKSTQVYSTVSTHIPNYYTLLWMVRRLFRQVLDTKGDPRILYALASLCGHIGVHRTDQLLNFADELAQQQETAQMAALALEPMAFKSDHYRTLLGLLNIWIPAEVKPEQVANLRARHNAAAFTLSLVYEPVADAAAKGSAEADQLRKNFSKLLKLLVEQTAIHPSETEASVRVISNWIENLRQQKTNSVTDDLTQKVINAEKIKFEAGFVIDHVVRSIILILSVTSDISRMRIGDVVTMAREWIREGIDVSRRNTVIQREEDEMKEFTEELDPDRARYEQQKQAYSLTSVNISWLLGLLMLKFLYLSDDKLNELEAKAKEYNDARQGNHPSASDSPDKDQNDADEWYRTGVEPKESATDDRSSEVQDDISQSTPKTAAKSDNRLDTDSIQAESPPEIAANADMLLDADVAKPNSSAEVATAQLNDVPEAVAPDNRRQNEGTASDEPQMRAAPEKPPEVVTRHLSQVEIETSLRHLIDALPELLASSFYNINMKVLLSQFSDKSSVKEFFNDSKLPRDIINKRAHFEWLRQLVDISPIELALDAMGTWFDLLEPVSGTWVNAVYPKLLTLVNNALPAERAVLRRALFASGWLQSKHITLQMVARSLLARCNIMDGIVTDLPHQRYGLILLNSRQQPWGESNFVGTSWIARWYREAAKRIAEQMQIISPVKILTLGVDLTLQDTQLMAYRNTGTLIQPPSRQRPPQLMPLIEGSPEAEALDPSQIHYVLVLSLVDSLAGDTPKTSGLNDLADFVELGANALGTKVEAVFFDPFASKSERENARTVASAAAQSAKWAWADKLVLLTDSRYRLQADIREHLTHLYANGKPAPLNVNTDKLSTVIEVGGLMLDSDDIYRIEQIIQRKIPAMLREMALPDWESSLKSVLDRPEDAPIVARTNAVEHLPPIDIAALEPVRERLSGWVKQLDDIAHAQHPKDISLTIAWSVLAVAQHDIASAVDIIVTWLETVSDDATTTREQTIGLALTRLLFNYYRRAAPEYISTLAAPMTPLIRPFIQAARGYDDVEWVMQILYEFSVHASWSQALDGDEDGRSVLDSLTRFADPTDVDRAVKHANTQLLIRQASVLYAQINLSWAAFNRIFQIVSLWVISTDYANRTDKRAVQAAIRQSLARPPFELNNLALSDTQIADLEVLSSAMDTYQLRQAVLSELLAIRTQLTPDRLDELQKAQANIARVTGVVNARLNTAQEMLHSFDRLNGRSKYGLILVEGHSAAMVKLGIGALTVFRKRIQSEQLDPIALRVHRIGRRDIVYDKPKGAPTPLDLRRNFDGMPAYTIGPILDRYPADQISFILILSDRAVHDLEDWAEIDNMRRRIWVHTLSGHWSMDLVDTGLRPRIVKNADVEEVVREIIEKAR